VPKDTPHILLINPWIHDFAAYDFWAKPLGLLNLAAILRQHGFRISYIDCQDRRLAQSMPSSGRHRFGRGPFVKTRIPKPRRLADIPRHWCRYGMLPERFDRLLAEIPTPDLILVTSIMTYWYPGLQETIGHLKTAFPSVPVVLGGIYATLCQSHAFNHSGADRVVAGPADDKLLQLMKELTGYAPQSRFDPRRLDSYPYPAFDLQHRIDYVPLLTSKGCPFACAYCAAKVLNPEPMRRSPESVVAEIQYWHTRYAVTDFAFYDDALLMDAEHHALPIFEGIVRTGLNLRFHTPNALHIRAISPRTARWMRRAGFETIRLGLETAGVDQHQRLDFKVTLAEFRRAVECLQKAGFARPQIGAYLLVGLPDQSLAEIKQSISVVKQSQAIPILAHYSPIPQTELWAKAVVASRYPLQDDPIYTNNAIQPCQKAPFSWQKMSDLKQLVAA
jgi:radical SAM superfamily enzyme YgiQ (UPF0313 family)